MTLIILSQNQPAQTKLFESVQAEICFSFRGIYFVVYCYQWTTVYRFKNRCRPKCTI